jgi:hypothetical protein
MENEMISASPDTILESSLFTRDVIVKLSNTKQNHENILERHKETNVESDKNVDNVQIVDNNESVDNVKIVDTDNNDLNILIETKKQRRHLVSDDIVENVMTDNVTNINDVVENVINENVKVKEEFELDSKLNGREIGRIWIFGYKCHLCNNFSATSRQLLMDHTSEVHNLSGTVKAA